MRMYYMAHPVAPYGRMTKGMNLVAAKQYFAAIQIAVPHVVIVAPWIPLCEMLDEPNGAEIDLILDRDCEIVSRCNGIILAGERTNMSSGMRREYEAATRLGLHVIDVLGIDWRDAGFCVCNEVQRRNCA